MKDLVLCCVVKAFDLQYRGPPQELKRTFGYSLLYYLPAPCIRAAAWPEVMQCAQPREDCLSTNGLITAEQRGGSSVIF